jgi:hypothetical protein
MNASPAKESSMSHDAHPPRRRQHGRVSSGLVFGAFALIAAFFLFTEHRAHLFGWLPFLLLAACPLLHLLHGHGGHGGHQGPGRQGGQGDERQATEPPAAGSPQHHHH